jgi:hypothetical protein
MDHRPVSSGVTNRFSVHLKVAGGIDAPTEHGATRLPLLTLRSGYSATGITGTSRSRHYNTDDVPNLFPDGPAHLRFHHRERGETD